MEVRPKQLSNVEGLQDAALLTFSEANDLSFLAGVDLPPLGLQPIEFRVRILIRLDEILRPQDYVIVRDSVGPEGFPYEVGGQSVPNRIFSLGIYRTWQGKLQRACGS